MQHKESSIKPSGHNIFRGIKDSKNYFLVNLLSKNADILEPETAERYVRGELTPEEQTEFLEKGYLSDPAEEASLFKRRYIDFLEARDDSEVQIFFVPSYGCNFACTYCYQEEYENPAQQLTVEIIDAFFSYLDGRFADKLKYITIFGGEPLLPSSRQKELMQYFIQQANARSLSLAVVTNGYLLDEYLDILVRGDIREVQVTLDGTEEVHNRRRPLKKERGKLEQKTGGTFDRIAAGIDETLKRGLPVNLRVVVDKENIHDLPALAEYAKARGWTGNDMFKTQLGRNYELHTCQKGQGKLFGRLEMYEEMYSLLEENPLLAEFHRPAFSIGRFLFENGELPEALFDSCPGCKTEWALDYTGRIYSCTATVGKTGESLGTFYPEVRLDEEAVEEWEDRDVTSISQCVSCNLRLACGGGCAAVAKNKTGSLLSPDCRPVDRLISLGVSAYFEKEIIK